MAEGQKVAIVTGAAQGIGKIITSCLLSHGYQVYLFDINPVRGNETEKEFQQLFGETKASFVQCDVASKKQITDAFLAVVNECGRVSLVVNNAGIMNEHDYERCIAINLTGVVTGTNLAVDHMRTDKGGKGGKIININSISALTQPRGIPTYCATKGAVLNFTRSWAKSLISESVSCMCMVPEITDTELVKSIPASSLDPAYFKERIDNMVLIRVDQFEQSFLELLNNGKNGSVLRISPMGTEYLFEASETDTQQQD